MIGSVYSNGNGTCSIERKSKKLPDTYNAIDQAATELMALVSKRPVVAKAPASEARPVRNEVLNAIGEWSRS